MEVASYKHRSFWTATRRNLKALPPYCYAYHPVHRYPIQIFRGRHFVKKLDRFFDVRSENARLGITEQQINAMINGIMFGFHIEAAHPSSTINLPKKNT